MYAIKPRHYGRRLRTSERLHYRIARFMVWAIPLSLLVLGVAYAIAGRG
jgi:hypothetical protein